MKVAFNDTATLKVAHPVTGEVIQNDGRPMTITVYGIESKKYQQVKSAIHNKRLAHRGPMTAEKEFSYDMDLLADCTASVDNLDLGDGPISIENIRKEYVESKWLRDQVDMFMADRAAFLEEQEPTPTNA